MASISLSQRLQALSDSYKSTLGLIQELQKFPAGTTPLSDDLDEQRLELANSCHQSLKDAEESLELLRQELDDYDNSKYRRARSNTARDEEQERNATTVSRLAEDIRHTRGAFRRAQLQSKKNLDARKQKDRELLFANRRSGAPNGTAGAPPARQRGQEKLTQDELAQNAADDVTRALRRTHAMLSSNLQQSAFAQQTLEESQEQLQTLSQRYTGTTDMLQKSRGLVKTLVTSQKSDTWYLQTSVYILLATIAWLVFRRLLYGPLWWFAYLPVKYMWWALSLVFGGASAAIRSGETKNVTASPSTGLEVPKNTPGVQWHHHAIPPKGAGWGGKSDPEQDLPPSPDMVDEVKRMVKNANEGTSMTGNEEQPRNPKKRMMELEKEQEKFREERLRDEL
ncbi:Protein transport protein sec20 [Knufia obscura]|uniref:Protein transport protein sec20 n=2 Tax=Knufia TaxID=430999 RepID=A0AAN8EKJ2_9EURO|nr:Protein transport protein sec20 [Knufia obscura]KAK5957468.1 Protein transport protein sec20 [Knufia fluminis]